MKMKGGLIGLVVIVLALIFIGPGNVGATRCYNLYLTSEDYINCSDDMDFSGWESMKIALHRDSTWESEDFLVGGLWDVFGNAIGIIMTDGLWFGDSYPMFAGTKTGSAKLLPDPYKSKANIAKAQGYYTWANGGTTHFSCWVLKKLKTSECPWISE